MVVSSTPAFGGETTSRDTFGSVDISTPVLHLSLDSSSPVFHRVDAEAVFQHSKRGVIISM